MSIPKSTQNKKIKKPKTSSEERCGDLLQNAVAFEFTSAPDHVCNSLAIVSLSSKVTAGSSLREDGAVLLNALKHYDDVRLSNLGMELHNKLDGEANQTTAVCKLIQEGYMKILAAAV
ncbi:hypothetical protein F2Q69_00058373 [Brassica cretica]|uniref:Uncharacterized protein n=1 Tax=Brassica cretica TaxID=69181 RepID=A0A8S9REU8_BRACR|nr:hypothetical protein F2Q69_00058373 [Brassica cretica]